MTISEIINKVSFNPRTLFLIDGFGALLSAFLLGVILVNFESVFGMPRKVLYFLAFLPGVFAIYDLLCYFWLTKKGSLFLKIIAIVNLVYCCISIGFVIYYFQQLTELGLMYFLLEFAVIIVLVFIEFKTAKEQR